MINLIFWSIITWACVTDLRKQCLWFEVALILSLNGKQSCLGQKLVYTSLKVQNIKFWPRQNLPHRLKWHLQFADCKATGGWEIRNNKPECFSERLVLVLVLVLVLILVRACACACACTCTCAFTCASMCACACVCACVCTCICTCGCVQDES